MWQLAPDRAGRPRRWRRGCFRASVPVRVHGAAAACSALVHGRCRVCAVVGSSWTVDVYVGTDTNWQDVVRVKARLCCTLSLTHDTLTRLASLDSLRRSDSESDRLRLTRSRLSPRGGAPQRALPTARARHLSVSRPHPDRICPSGLTADSRAVHPSLPPPSGPLLRPDAACAASLLSRSIGQLRRSALFT